MPMTKYFTVTQVRKVKVIANNIIDAAGIAQSAFANGETCHSGVSVEGVWGNTYSQVQVMGITSQEDNSAWRSGPTIN